MAPPSVPLGRNAFYDPEIGYLCLWYWNHQQEQSGARIRAIDNQQPTKARWKSVRAIRTQAGRDELVYKLAGKVPNLAQHEAFLYFEDVSQRHTIYFHHFSGEMLECQLTDYEPERRFQRGHGTREDYLWVYSMQIDVVSYL